MTISFPAGLSPAPERRAPAEVVESVTRRYEGVLSPECVAIGDELTATVEFNGYYGSVDGPTLVRAARFVWDVESSFRSAGRRCEIGVNARMG